MILGLKLGRRLLAAVAFNDEEPILCDSHFVPSQKDELERRVARYFNQLISQVKPVEIFYYAPTGSQTVTERLVDVLNSSARTAGLAATRLRKRDLFSSLGVPPPRTRRELRECLSVFVHQVGENKAERQVVIAEAAAAALVGEVTRGLRDQ